MKTTANTPVNNATNPAATCCQLPDDGQVVRMAALAKALADPIRLRMLGLMAEGRGCCGLPDPASRGVPGATDPQGICVCEFQERFGLGQSKTSYHLRVLRDAGLVTEETRGKWTFYELNGEAVEQALQQFRNTLKPSASATA
jgi:ArsR family transcriptional regulator